MGQFTIQVVGDAGVGTRTKTYTVSDEDINRLVAYARALGSQAGINNPTVAQGLLVFADALFANVKAQVRSHEINVNQPNISEIVGT